MNRGGPVPPTNIEHLDRSIAGDFLNKDKRTPYRRQGMIAPTRIKRRVILWACVDPATLGLVANPGPVESLVSDPKIYMEGRRWYVDKDSSGSGDGSTWAKAWKRFQDINWID